MGISPTVVTSYHQGANFDNLCLGKISLDQFWQDMQKAGADPDLDLAKIWYEEAIKNRKLNTELLHVIAKLRQKYSAGALTNLTFTRLITDQKTGLYNHFDYAVLSCQEGLIKPDPVFYQLALIRAVAKPAEAIFIDDREQNIAAAQELGINSILYTYPDNRKLLKNLSEFGVTLPPKRLRS